jgi:linear primary-alkylsulfatase
MEILNKPVCAEPRNRVAKDLRADNCEQLGYHYESPSLRNSFLAAAKELCDGRRILNHTSIGSRCHRLLKR